MKIHKITKSNTRYKLCDQNTENTFNAQTRTKKNEIRMPQQVFFFLFF